MTRKKIDLTGLEKVYSKKAISDALTMVIRRAMKKEFEKEMKKFWGLDEKADEN